MKIIEKKEWTHPFTCGTCESKLEADGSDVQWDTFGGSYDEVGTTKYFVVCPVCGEYHFLKDTRKIPPNVMKNAIRKI